VLNIPRDQIIVLGINHRPGGVRRQAAVAIGFRWTDGDHTWFGESEAADALIRALEADFARRTAAIQAKGLGSELSQLGVLAREGIITPEEFERGKELFLGHPPDRQQQALQLLGQLHELYASGVLSESEFNLKKWDVLSRAK